MNLYYFHIRDPRFRRPPLHRRDNSHREEERFPAQTPFLELPIVLWIAGRSSPQFYRMFRNARRVCEL
jgi:hypothetical protein